MIKLNNLRSDNSSPIGSPEKVLCAAILLRAYQDLVNVPTAVKGIDWGVLVDIIIFLESDWCEVLCGEAGIDYSAYIGKMKERFAAVGLSASAVMSLRLAIRAVHGAYLDEWLHDRPKRS